MIRCTEYKIEIGPKASKALEKLPEEISLLVIEKIEALKYNPRPHGYKKLQGMGKELYRVRSGKYRIVYKVYDNILLIMVVRVEHRKDVYR